ncbi:MAG: PID-CTERM protein-sorting domain-containing protein [Bacteroidota bacterium]
MAQSSLPPSSFGSINDLPINQGVVMALAAGVAYGLKKLNSRKKQ